MYSPLPPEWDALIRSGAQRKTVIDVYADPSISVITLAGLPIKSWSVSVDRNSSVRRTAQIRVVEPALVAELIGSSSALEPYGSEIHIRSGFILPNGSEELVPLGIFQIEDLSWSEDETYVDIKLFDRAKSLERSSYGVHIDASGAQALSFITNTINNLLPYVVIDSSMDESALSVRFPGGTTYRGGRLQAVQEACKALGAELYFDVEGTARIVPIPYIDETTDISDYDWLVNVGEDGVLVSYSRSLTRKDTYNKVHVLGAPATQTTPQPYGFALDENPQSPTYYYGRFGQSDLRVERQELVSEGQCRTYALAQLRNSIGLSRSLGFTSLSNPAIDAGDRVQVRYPDGSVELHLVDSVKLSESGGMSVETRVRQAP